jgi:hypothetical protein
MPPGHIMTVSCAGWNRRLSSDRREPPSNNWPGLSAPAASPEGVVNFVERRLPGSIRDLGCGGYSGVDSQRRIVNHQIG